MGYDLSVENAPEPRPPWTPGGANDEAVEKWDAANYFRLNIWGMSAMRQEMTEALDWSHANSPWPAPPEEGKRSKAEYEADVEAMLTGELESGQVPAYKFSSNDGWLITPRECRTIASVLERALPHLRKGGDPAWRETVRLFIKFNRYAADHGGYRVE